MKHSHLSWQRGSHNRKTSDKNYAECSPNNSAKQIPDFHFRQYKPEYARFTQPDSLLPDVYDPQQLNKYAFERNNPYKYADEDGHLAFPLIILAVIGAAAIIFTIEFTVNSMGNTDSKNADRVGLALESGVESGIEEGIEQTTTEAAGKVAGKSLGTVTGIVSEAKLTDSKDTCDAFGGCNEEDRYNRLKEKYPVYVIDNADKNVEVNLWNDNQDSADSHVNNAEVKDSDGLFGSKASVSKLLTRLKSWYKEIKSERTSSSTNSGGSSSSSSSSTSSGGGS